MESKKLKPFDLEAAKRGEPIVTRDRRKAQFIGHIPQAIKSSRVVAFVEGCETPGHFYGNGKLTRHCNTAYDLFMSTKVRTVYVNLRPADANLTLGHDAKVAYHYDTEDKARRAARNFCDFAVAIAIPVEIEE